MKKAILVLVPLLLYIFSPLVGIGIGAAKTTLFDIRMFLSSRETIEREMDEATDVNKKIKLLIYFADTGINDDHVVAKLEDMLYREIPNSKFHYTAKEIISVGLVIHLSRSSRDDRFLKLVKIASNNLFTFSTRRIAIRKLIYSLPQHPKNTTVDKNEIKTHLQQLLRQILSSPNDFRDKDYQEMFYKDVLQVIQILEKD